MKENKYVVTQKEVKSLSCFAAKVLDEISGANVKKFWQLVMKNSYDYPEIYKFTNVLKVSKSQKQISKFSLEPKNERKYFCISALASKKRSNQKNKDILYYYLDDFI